MSTRLGKRKRTAASRGSVAVELAFSELPSIGALAVGAVGAPAASSRRLMLAALTAAIFLNAALLFALQPMFAKMVLPRLGGAPQVWSVAMVFFQAALLAGYGYAHFLTRALPGRASIAVQLALLLVASPALPRSVAAGWDRPPANGQALWLIGLFAVSVGLPFFALAANAPLLQAWFARTDHPAAKDPYFLYAASNVGSFLALVAYPFAIEPLIGLNDQTRLWSLGFGLLILAIAACGWLLWRAQGPAPVAAALPAGLKPAPTPTWRDAAAWVALAAVPSGLLVAVTAHISTDIAAVPLLWVVPLSLYLLSFVIVFSRRPVLPHRFVVAIQPLFVVALAATMVLPAETLAAIFGSTKAIVPLVALHLGTFFVCVLVCHGELARRRPPAAQLTAFYLWMAAGGMLGGLSAGLLAPTVFNWVAEYPILIVLAVLCRPGLAWPRRRSPDAAPTEVSARGAPRYSKREFPGFDWLSPLYKNRLKQAIVVGVLVLAAGALVALNLRVLIFDETMYHWAIAAALAVAVLFWRNPLPFAVMVAFVLFVDNPTNDPAGAKRVRSFFGVHKVWETPDGRFRLLAHGTTLHGAQRIRDDRGQPLVGRPDPITYYHQFSGMARVIDLAHVHASPIRYAVIGLGTGSLACYARPGDSVRYYEIDPTIVRIASDPGNFSFLSECGPVSITLGDARLTLADAPDESYDAIVVDAFNSDAIPIHLLTREAMAIYRRKLAAHGIVAVHVSNRYLDLVPVVAGIAAANGMVARLSTGGGMRLDRSGYEYMVAPMVVAIARTEEDFGPLVRSPYWQLLKRDPRQRVWTDDYSNVLGAIVRKLAQ
jgi:hypothetical protein